MVTTGGYGFEKVNQTCLSVRKVKPRDVYFTRLPAVIYAPEHFMDLFHNSPEFGFAYSQLVCLSPAAILK